MPPRDHRTWELEGLPYEDSSLHVGDGKCSLSVIVPNREARSEKRGHLVWSRTSHRPWDSQDWLPECIFPPGPLHTGL